jgi:Pectate lyase superfamily protein
VNIKSPKFGATGNGSHDDTAAFQAAIDYAFAHNLTAVYCPAGNSITSNTIYLDPPGSMRPFTFKGYISNGSGSGSAGNNLTVTRAPYGGILQGSNGVTTALPCRGRAAWRVALTFPLTLARRGRFLHHSRSGARFAADFRWQQLPRSA